MLALALLPFPKKRRTLEIITEVIREKLVTFAPVVKSTSAEIFMAKHVRTMY
jgi:hypothetical protein